MERRQLSSTAANRRCLLLDGAGCHSVRAFREGGGREAEEIVVPNVVSTTYQSIQEQVSGGSLADGFCCWAAHSH